MFPVFFEKQASSILGCQLGNVRGDGNNIGKAFELMIHIITTSTPVQSENGGVGDSTSSSVSSSSTGVIDPSTSTDGSSLETKGGKLKFVLLIPSLTIGFLLGTKGTTLKQTKEQSGAHITISGRNGSLIDPASGISQQPVAIEGEAEQVLAALRLIVKQIEIAYVTSGAKSGSPSVVGPTGLGLGLGAENYSGYT